MMDLLIHVGTTNKINPGDHIVQVRNERGIELPYKPSTPIGKFLRGSNDSRSRSGVHYGVSSDKSTKLFSRHC
jgi:hypothetical protein